VLRPSARPPFVGRDQELSVLVGAFEEALAGHGRLVLVIGEPGIGKTRLADELAGQVRDRGGLVLWGRSWADAGAQPYWPWIQGLRAYLRAVDAETARAVVGPVAADIAQLVPEARKLFPRVTEVEVEASEATRFRLFDSFATILREAAARRPMALLLDDLQAADAASGQLLRFVTAQLDSIGLLIVGTYRDLEAPDEPGAVLVAALSRESACFRLRLEGLPSPAISSLLEVETGTPPRRALVSSLARMTSGNPLFLGETIRLMRAEGRLEELGEPGSVRQATLPASLQAVIHDRLARLPAATLDLLQQASAIGPEFETRLLARIAKARGSDPAGIGPDGVVDGLGPAVGSGLLFDLGTGSFRFAHDQVRQSLYQELAPAERFDLHARIARSLEADPVVVGTHLAELAFHLHEAELASHYGLSSPKIDPGEVVDYAARAARQAWLALAFEDAAHLYEMALHVLADHPGTGGPGRLELLLALGDAEARAGDLTAARGSFLAAAAIAREGGAGAELAQAALGYGGRFIWSRAGDDQELVPLLEDALALLDASGAHDRLRVRVMARLACAWRSEMAHRADSDRLSQGALELARAGGDQATLMYALAGRFWATYWPDNAEERLGLADELLAVANRAGDVERTYDGHQSRCAALLDLGRITEARSQVMAAREAARASRQPPQQVGIQAYEVVLALLAGAFAQAEAQIASLGADAGINAIRDDLSTHRIHLFLLRREQARVVELEDSIRASIDAFPWYPYFRAALVCLLLDVGRDQEARARFDELAEGKFQAIYPDCEWLLGLALASDACARLGDPRAAATLYRTLLPYAGRHAVAHAEGSMGSVDRYLGLLAITLGRIDDAQRHLGDAVLANERLGAWPWAAHARVDLAAAILDTGAADARDRASRLLDAASDVADQLGMTALRARVGAVRVRHAEVLGFAAGAVAPGDTVTAIASQGPGAASRVAVFRREGEYWTLRFDEAGCRLRDSKGMRYLAQLLANPGREMHVLDLVGPPRAGRAGADWQALPGDAGELLDAEARSAYRQRLRDLEADLAEAEAWNDPERAARLSAERAALVEQLAAAVGLGGRARRAGSSSERARLSVAKAIRSTMRRIDIACGPLGRHLAVAVHTGTFCSYAPDPGLGLTWDLRAGSDA
jgi:hypothetical protein